MMEKAKVIRLFVASPGDIRKERKRLDTIVEQINSSSIKNNRYLVELKKWETHTYPAAGRPQGIILEQIGKYDIFIGIMWKQFGSPTGKAESGTEEEFRDALNRFKDGEVKHIAFFFCEKNIPFLRNDDEVIQLRKVLKFRRELEKDRSIYYKTYKTIDDFDREVRNLIENITPKFLPGNIPKEEYDIETNIEMAKKFSSLGKYQEAIKLLVPLSDNCLKKKDYLKASEIEHLIALQYRHDGHFTKTLEHYARSETYIMKASSLPIHSKVMHLRIKAGRIMVEEYFLKGQCKKAYESYERLNADINDLLSDQYGSVDVCDMVRGYELHLLRQQAEMLRISGRYNESLRIFSDVFEKYDYTQHLPKVYSLLGIGDSLRLMGKSVEALDKYSEVEKYAVKNKDDKLLSRVLRSKFMALYEIENGRSDTLTETLQRLSRLNANNSRFNRIYYLLAVGMNSLTKDLLEAEQHFKEAIELTKTKQGCLCIEYLHGSFGLAECQRMTTLGNDDPHVYLKLHEGYKKIGLTWGEVRTLVAFNALRASEHEPVEKGGDIPMEGEDFQIWNKSLKSKMGINIPIFKNIP